MSFSTSNPGQQNPFTHLQLTESFLHDAALINSQFRAMSMALNHLQGSDRAQALMQLNEAKSKLTSDVSRGRVLLEICQCDDERSFPPSPSIMMDHFEQRERLEQSKPNLDELQADYQAIKDRLKIQASVIERAFNEAKKSNEDRQALIDAVYQMRYDVRIQEEVETLIEFQKKLS